MLTKVAGAKHVASERLLNLAGRSELCFSSLRNPNHNIGAETIDPKAIF